MKVAATGARVIVNPRAGFGLLAALAATAMLLGACQGGSSRRTDHAYWQEWFGDPDTQRPCCANNH